MFTQTKTKLLMSTEGGLSPKVKMISRLPLKMSSTRVQEATADMERLRAVSCELEAIEQDFNETEQLVIGY